MVDLQKQKVAIDYQRCNPQSCEKGICQAVLACPRKLWKQEGPYDFPFPTPGFCEDCGKCIESCPHEAIYHLPS